MNAHLEAVQLVATLDFTLIRKRLITKDGWNQSRVDAAERGYREFLALAKANPGESLVPTEEVDEFWHYHILDTYKYQEDCLLVFGYFFHHDPNLEKGSVELNELFARTQELQDEIRGKGASCLGSGASCAGRCRGMRKPKKVQTSACTGNGGACAGRCKNRAVSPAVCGGGGGTNCIGKATPRT